MTSLDIDSFDDRPFVVQLDAFSGPLDLLLHLIREQEIDIGDIPIAAIAEQFLAAIEKLGINQAADYLEMAARLLRIKIRLLLPRPLDDDEWEDPRAELVRRLLEYEQTREVADLLSARATISAERFPRGWIPDPPSTQPLLPEIIIDLEGVVRAVERVIDAMPQPVIHRVVPRPLDIEGATKRIRELLADRRRIDFQEIVGDRPHVSLVISVLIALLELARLGEARLVQTTPFEEFKIVGESPSAAA